MKKALAALRQQASVPGRNEKTVQQIVAYVQTLREQLHTAKKLAKSLKYVNTHQRLPLSGNNLSQRGYRQLHNVWLTLRANLTLRSATFRHAIRLGILLALTTALYRLLNLPLGRGYWIPLTALLVLRPDFTSTFSRGVARMVGTILGAVLTTLLVAFFVPSQWALIVLIGLFAFLAFSTLFANYAVFSTFVTVEVVFLLSLVYPQTFELAASRAIDTTIGGALALLTYLLWPTWEHSQVPEHIAKRLDTLREYFDAVMQAYANPDTYNEATLHERHLETRLARSNAEGSVQRAAQEPRRSNLAIYQGLLDAANAIARDVFMLEAYLIDNPSRHTLPEVTDFASKVDEALNILANAIRTEQPVTEFPDLLQALHELQAAKREKHAQAGTRADLRFVIAKAKEIVQNIQAIQQLLPAQAAT